MFFFNHSVKPFAIYAASIFRALQSGALKKGWTNYSYKEVYMSVEITSVQGKLHAATGLSVTWEEGQYVMIIAEKGLVACGIVDMAVATKFSFAVAVADGTPEKPLVTVDDLLEATVSEVTEKAASLGVTVGMTGKEALEKLTD